MNRLAHLLACVGEEAGEISQAVGKAQRFGLLDTNPSSKNSNWDDLLNEYHDMVAVIEMLCDEFGSVVYLVDRERVDRKKQRVEKWMIYAEQVKNKEGQL